MASLFTGPGLAGEIQATGGALGLGTTVNGQVGGSCVSGGCQVGGGTGAGSNLFHRFSGFDTRGAITGVNVNNGSYRNVFVGVTNPMGSFIDKVVSLSSAGNLFWLSPGGISISGAGSFQNVQQLNLSTATGWKVGSALFDVAGTTAGQAALLTGTPVTGLAGAVTEASSLAALGLQKNGDLSLAGGLLTVDAGLLLDAQGGNVLLQAAGIQVPGGNVDLSGANVALQGSRIDVSSSVAGGTVRIGGDRRGANPTFPNARTTSVDAGSSLRADGLGAASGGQVIVYATDATRVDGTISVRGGAQGGNAGFVETSGGYLEVTQAPDLAAAAGRAGTWLLDPYNINIVSGSPLNSTGASPFQPTDSPSEVSTTTIAAALDAGGTVIVDTTNVSGTQPPEAGNISVNAPITTTAGAGAGAILDLRAHNDININADITSTSGALDLNLVADQDASGAGEVKVINGITTTLDLRGGTAAVLNGDGAGGTTSGTLRIEDIALTSASPTTLVLAGGSNLTAGQLVIGNSGSATGGTFTGNGITVAGQLVQSAGDLNGAGDLTLTGTGSTWSGGRWSGGGSVLVNSNASLTVDGSNALSPPTWSGRTLNIANGGAVTITGDNYVTGTRSFGSSGINSRGSLVLQGGRLFTNALSLGTIAIVQQSGATSPFAITGTSTIDLLATASGAPGGSLTNNSTLTVGTLTAPGSLTLSAEFSNQGTVLLEAGSLLDLPNVATLAFTQAGTIGLGAGSTLRAEGFTSSGTIQGSGTVDLIGATLQVNGTSTTPARLQPGGADTSGTLTIDGNLSFGPDAVVDIDIAGSLPGTSYDVLAVTGTATLSGGVMATSLIATPQRGDSLQVVTATGGLTGTFSSITGLTADFTSVYGPNSLDLVRCTSACWDGGAGSDTRWTTAANWSFDTLPTPADIVYIERTSGASVVLDSGLQSVKGLLTLSANDLSITGGTLSLDDPATTSILDGALTLSGGSLSGTGALQVTGGFTQTGGVLGTGFGSVAITQPSGGLTVNGVGAVGDVTLRSLGGALNLTGPLSSGGAITLTAGGSTGGDVTLGGVITSTGTGAPSLAVTADGAINLNADVQGLSGPLTATFRTDNDGIGGEVLNWGNATLNLNGGTAQVLGNGAAGTASIAGSSTPGLAVGSSLNLANLQVTGGTLTVDGALTLSGALSQSAGSLDGSGVVALNGVGNSWSGGGWFGTGSVALGAGSTLAISGTPSLGVRSITGSGAVSNTGTLSVDGSTISAPFSTSGGGGVSVTGGTLQLTGGGSDDGATYSTATGSRLVWGGGTRTIGGGGASAGGTGSYEVASGSLVANGPLTFTAPLTLSGGSLSGTGALQVTGGFTQTGGVLGTGFGSVAITQPSGGLTVNGVGAVGDVTLRSLGGALNLTGPLSSGGAITLTAGGSTGGDVTLGGVITSTGTGAPSLAVTADGAINLNADVQGLSGPLTATFRTDNDGIGGEVLNWGNATLNLNGGTAQVLGNGAAGTASIAGSSTPGLAVGSSLNLANLQVTGGTLTVDGALTLSGALSQSAGSLDGSGVVALNGVGNSWSGGGWFGTGSVALGAGSTLAISGTPSLGVRSITGSGAVSNTGTLSVDGSTISAPFSTSGGGGVSVTGGTLQLTGGGSDDGATYSTATGSRLVWGGGTRTIGGGGASAGGTGSYEVASGSLVANGPLTFTAPLTLSGGSLSGTGALQVTGGFTQTGGVLGTGFGSVAITQPSGGLTVNGVGAVGDVTLRSLGGALNLTGPLSSGGAITLTAGGSTGGDVTLGGVITSTGTGAPSLAVTADGAINLNADVQGLSGPLTATFRTDNDGIGGEVLNWGNATLNLNGGTAQVLGNGAAGTASIAGSSTPGLAVGSSLNLANLQVTGGTLTVDGALTLSGALSQSAGSLDGSGVVALNGVGNSWSGGGWFGTGSVALGAGSTLAISGTPSLGVRSITGSGAVSNTGTLSVDGSTISAPFSTSGGGGVSVTGGTLQLTGGGSDDGATYSTATGSRLVWGGGTRTIGGGGASAGGTGSYEVASGSLVANGPLTFTAPLTLSGGSLSGTGALQVTGGFTQTGGVLGTGFGSVAITQPSGGLTVNGVGAVGDVTLRSVSGPLTLLGAVGSAGGTVDFASLGPMLLASGSSITSSGGAVSLASNDSLSLVSSALNVSGATAGGTLQLDGSSIAIDSSTLNTSGVNDGGQIRIGLRTLPSSVAISNSSLIADPPALGGTIVIDGRVISITGSSLNVTGGSGGLITLGSSSTSSLTLDALTSLIGGGGASFNLFASSIFNNASFQGGRLFLNGAEILGPALASAPLSGQVLLDPGLLTDLLSLTSIDPLRSSQIELADYGSPNSLLVTQWESLGIDPLSITLTQSAFLIDESWLNALLGPNVVWDWAGVFLSTDLLERSLYDQPLLAANPLEPLVGSRLGASSLFPPGGWTNFALDVQLTSSLALAWPVNPQSFLSDRAGGLSNGLVPQLSPQQVLDEFASREQQAMDDTAAKLGLDPTVKRVAPTPSEVQQSLRKVIQAVRQRVRAGAQ